MSVRPTRPAPLLPPVTAHTAAALPPGTGCPADFWLVHEARYAGTHRHP